MIRRGVALVLLEPEERMDVVGLLQVVVGPLQRKLRHLGLHVAVLNERLDLLARAASPVHAQSHSRESHTKGTRSLSTPHARDLGRVGADDMSKP
jgi:hypothetical protein